MSIIKAIKEAEKMAKIREWNKTFWFFDIHGTILKPNYEVDNISKEFYPYAKETLQLLSERDDVCMGIYTCSHPHEIVEYEALFKSNGIKFEMVNENPEVKTEDTGYGNYEKKPYMNVLLEDKASFNPETEWEDVLYYIKDRGSNSDTNTRNEELFNKFKEEHINNGGELPQETALTNLVAHVLKRGSYKQYNGGGSCVDGERIKKYDVILWLSLTNDPYFMVALDVDEGDQCDFYRCNNDCKIEKKVF